MSDEQPMPCFAVLAVRRDDWTEAIVGLARTEQGARQFGQKIAAAWPLRFVRCRVRPMHLTSSQVRAICREWGRVDALAGVPLRPTKFPKPYDAAYRRGHRAGLEEAHKARDVAADGSRRNGHEE